MKTKTASNSKQPSINFKKYGSLLLLVVSFLALILALALTTYIATQRFEQVADTQKVINKQSIIVQDLTKNLLNINLYASNQIASNSTTPTPAPAPAPTASATTTTPTPAPASAPTLAEDQLPLSQLPQTALYRIDDINEQRALFNNTLSALKNGGETSLLDGSKVTVPAITDPELLKYLSNIERIWTPYEGLLTNFSSSIQNGILDKTTSDYLVEYTRLYNQPLQAELNSITTNLNATTAQNANMLRIIQAIGILISFIIFTLIVFGVLRRLARTDAELSVAKKQTDDIMKTVNEGLFLINKDLVIADQYSGKLEEILNQKNIAGRSLYDVLEGMISPKDMDTTKLFVEQLYNVWVVEELIQDLNPLKQVMISYMDDDNSLVTQYLEFNFLRVMNENQSEIESVFVSVLDTTNEVRLQTQMQKDKEQHNRQIEMISYLLSVDNRQLIYFLNETNARIERMNNILKDRNVNDLKGKAQQLYRETHSLKGDASAVKLNSLVDIAEKQEDKLKELMDSHNLKGNDFLPVTINLDEMVNMVSFIETLVKNLNLHTLATTQNPLRLDLNRFNHLASQNDTTSPNDTIDTQPLANMPTNNPESATNAPEPSYWQSFFEQYASDIAKRQGKQVTIDVKGFDETFTNQQNISVYKDIAIQLLKNAIVHGIETPEVRTASGKMPTGHVSLSFEPNDNQTLSLKVKDDGAGIHWDKLRQRAVEKGAYTAEEIEQLQPKDLLRLMFISGVSTADKQDEDAGRGIGMDIVKQLVKEMGGKIGIHSSTNQFTQINVTFPEKLN